jgi:hypothetical protein
MIRTQQAVDAEFRHSAQSEKLRHGVGVALVVDGLLREAPVVKIIPTHMPGLEQPHELSRPKHFRVRFCARFDAGSVCQSVDV